MERMTVKMDNEPTAGCGKLKITRLMWTSRQLLACARGCQSVSTLPINTGSADRSGRGQRQRASLPRSLSSSLSCPYDRCLTHSCPYCTDWKQSEKIAKGHFGAFNKRVAELRTRLLFV